MKKGVGSGVGSRVGSGSISQRYGSGDPDPDPHQNVTDPQHWCLYIYSIILRFLNSATPESLLSTERPSIGSILSSSVGEMLFSSLGETTSSGQEEKAKKISSCTTVIKGTVSQIIILKVLKIKSELSV
jgi:hypothetical protein